MKLKFTLALLTGLLLSSVTMQAIAGQDGASVTVEPSTANPNPVCLGSPVSVTVNGKVQNPQNSSCEIKITRWVWIWTAKDNSGTMVKTKVITSSQADGGCSWTFPWTPATSGNKTVTVSASVSFIGTDCHGSYSTTASGSVGVPVTVVSPVWGAWTVATAPAISIAFADPGDQCVQIPAGSTSGDVSVSAAQPIITPGTKKRSDNNNGCQPDQTAPLNIDSVSTTWTASGCGITPISGDGTTAKFKVNVVGQYTVAFTAHGTTTDPSGSPDSSATTATLGTKTFQVWLNSANVCTPTPPAARLSVGMPDMAILENWYEPQTMVNIVLGIGQISHWMSGTCKNISGTERYSASGGIEQPTGCGYGLDLWFTPTHWTWTGTLTASYSIYPVTITGSTTTTVTGPQLTSHIFNKPNTPHISWYGQKYDHFYNPTQGVFVGLEVVSSDGSNPIVERRKEYKIEDNYMLNPSGGEYVVTQVGAVCPVACCPTN